MHALPKSISIFLPVDNYGSTRLSDIVRISSHVLRNRILGGLKTYFAILNEKSRGSLTFEFVALGRRGMTVLSFSEKLREGKGDSKKISSQIIAGHRLQTACRIRVGGTRNFIVFQSCNLISGSPTATIRPGLNEFYLNIKTIQEQSDIKRIILS